MRPLEASALLADEPTSRGVGDVWILAIIWDDQIADTELLEFGYLIPVEDPRLRRSLG